MQVEATPAPARPILFDDALDIEMGERLVKGLADAAQRGDSEVTILINSPGGRGDVMLEVYDALRLADHAGLRSRCVVLSDGMAASAAAVILQGCSERVMHSSASLLFHEGSGVVRGKSHDQRRAAGVMEDLDARIAALIAHRMHMTAKEYLAWVADHDRWLDAAGALEIHAADTVIQDP
jgi:ATP-dependent protease ClpP protease subunit